MEDPSFAEFCVEHASLHIVPLNLQDSTNNLMINVLNYLDGKEATARRKGAFSHVVATTSHLLYLDDRTHFLIKNKDYVSTYLMYGGKMNVPASINKSFPLLNKVIDHFPYKGQYPPTTEFLYEKFEDDAPFYYSGFVEADIMDDPLYSEYHFALVEAGIGARMDPRLMSATMNEERLEQIVSYLERVSEHTYGDYMIDRCFELLDSVVELSENYLINLDLLKRVATVLGDVEFVYELDYFGSAFRLKHLSYGVKGQLLGLPISEPWVNERIVNERMELFLAGKDDPIARGKRLNELAVETLTKQLKEIYSTEIYLAHPKDVDLLNYSPIDLFIFNEGPIIYVLSRDELRYDMINPRTNNYLSETYQTLAYTRFELGRAYQLLTPVEMSEILELVEVPTTPIFKALNR